MFKQNNGINDSYFRMIKVIIYAYSIKPLSFIALKSSLSLNFEAFLHFFLLLLCFTWSSGNDEDEAILFHFL